MEAQVSLTEIEIRGLKLALIFGVPHPAPDEIVSAREKLSKAQEAFAETGDPRDSVLPGFRSTDPTTSRKAALAAFPRTQSQRYKALMSIAKRTDGPWHGATWVEVEFDTGINGVWKRISELKEGQWIEVVGQRKTPTTKTEADVYVITDKARRFIQRNS